MFDIWVLSDGSSSGETQSEILVYPVVECWLDVVYAVASTSSERARAGREASHFYLVSWSRASFDMARSYRFSGRMAKQETRDQHQVM